MNRLLREPFVHFLLLGGLLFALHAWLKAKDPSLDAPRSIEVTEAVMERLRAGFVRQFNRLPDEDEWRGLIAAHIREEVLCREALALGLDRDDTIVRRRLAQKMEFLTEDLVGGAEPNEKELQRYFAEHQARYVRPGRMSFRHIYFSKERRGTAANAAALEALDALRQGALEESFGDPFLHGDAFAGLEPADMTALFGSAFAAQASSQALGRWSEPMTSSYGLHLVFVEAHSEPAGLTFAEARATLIRDFIEERRRTGNQEVFERLRRRYHITIATSAMARTAQAKETTALVTP